MRKKIILLLILTAIIATTKAADIEKARGVNYQRKETENKAYGDYYFF